MFVSVIDRATGERTIFNIELEMPGRYLSHHAMQVGGHINLLIISVEGTEKRNK